jgi:hypothetical protein
VSVPPFYGLSSRLGSPSIWPLLGPLVSERGNRATVRRKGARYFMVMTTSDRSQTR